MELVRKSDIWFGDKALDLKATVADVILYCQLGKMAVNSALGRNVIFRAG